MLKCKMTQNDTVSQTSSMDLIKLAKSLNNDHLRDKLLDSLMLNGRIHKRRARFKVHPDTLSSSSDSDIPNEPYRNGFHNHHHLYNCRETDICNVKEAQNDSTVYLMPPKQYVQSHSYSEVDHAPTATVRQSPSRVKKKAPLSSKANEAKRKQMETKLLTLLKKIHSCTEDIKFSLDVEIARPDGEADWERRRKRSAEFCARFQRNYLYQLVLQITDLQKGKNSDNVLQSLTGAHQTLLQAFQAYHNYIPISLGDLVVDKVRSVVNHTKELCFEHDKLLKDDSNGLLKKDLMEKIQTKCTAILSKANEIMARQLDVVKRSVTKSSPLLKKKSARKKTLSDKLSMYSSPNICKKHMLWKKTLEKMSDTTRVTPRVQSRYKTAVFKHRPPVNKFVSVKPKPLPKRGFPSIKETPAASPKNDDDIETMVNKQCQEKNHCVHNGVRWESVVMHLKSLCDSISGAEEKVVSQEQLENLLKNVMEMALTGKINSTTNGRIGSHTNGCKQVATIPVMSLPNLFEAMKIQNGKVPIKNGHSVEHAVAESVLAIKTGENKNKSTDSLQNQWKTLQITGEKNAQLICIKDEGSLHEIPRNPYPSLATLAPDPQPSLIALIPDEIKVEATPPPESVIDQPSKRETVPEQNFIVGKNSLTKKPGSKLQVQSPRKLKQLPKGKIKSILQGKLQHAKVMKNFPMYCKTSDNHPWEVVNNITHSLLEYILSVVSEEIQVSNILQSLYNSEFL